MTIIFPMQRVARRPLLRAKEIRKELAEYFLNRGCLKWQTVLLKGNIFLNILITIKFILHFRRLSNLLYIFTYSTQ